MRIDDKLNMVIPIQREGGHVVYVHVAPLSRETFEANYLVMSKTFALIMAEGLTIVSGPRVAFLALKDVAKRMNIWEGPEGVERSLVNEMIRLSNVAAPGENGWRTIPMHNAVTEGIFSEDELSEVLNAVTFFMLNSVMHKKDVLKPVLEGMCDLWGARISSLALMEFVGSLQTLTAGASIGATGPTASVPS